VDLHRAAGVHAALVGVRVLQVHLDAAEAVAEPRPERRLGRGPDRLRELVAVADVVVGTHLEDHLAPR
jgi:hypothetical protein